MSSNDHRDPPANAPANGATGRRVLRIISGLHAGASRELGAQEMLLIGSGDDCDIVLSDPGVAAHHALITLLAGTFSLRALDAPLQVGGRPLHPGDPVELGSLQRIELGSAALAVGSETDPDWNNLLPMQPGVAKPRSFKKHLPMIAGIGALSLVSVAIFAAVMPREAPEPPPNERIEPLIAEYQIVDGRTTVDAEGGVTVQGTIADSATRDRLQQRLRTMGLTARLDLRTGDDIARDVQEVLRSQGIAARAVYRGNGVVEIRGHFTDLTKLRTVVTSRTMLDVRGVRVVVPKEITPEPAPDTPVAVDEPKPEIKPVRIVSIVKGADPHVVDADGVKYRPGAELPGRGTLIAIGEQAWALVNGQTTRIVAEPLPPVDPATVPDAAAPAGPSPSPGAAALATAQPPAAGKPGAAPAAESAKAVPAAATPSKPVAGAVPAPSATATASQPKATAQPKATTTASKDSSNPFERL